MAEAGEAGGEAEVAPHPRIYGGEGGASTAWGEGGGRGRRRKGGWMVWRKGGSMYEYAYLMFVRPTRIHIYKNSALTQPITYAEYLPLLEMNKAIVCVRVCARVCMSV